MDTTFPFMTILPTAPKELRMKSRVLPPTVPEYKIHLVQEHFTNDIDGPVCLGRSEEVAITWRRYVTKASWYDCRKEAVVVFALNRKNRMLGFNLVSLGTATSSLVHPREVMRPVIGMGACAFILSHQHPSGDPTPSAADIQVTRSLREAAKIVDIDFLDHVIVGEVGDPVTPKGYFSFRQAGML